MQEVGMAYPVVWLGVKGKLLEHHGPEVACYCCGKRLRRKDTVYFVLSVIPTETSGCEIRMPGGSSLNDKGRQVGYDICCQSCGEKTGRG